MTCIFAIKLKHRAAQNGIMMEFHKCVIEYVHQAQLSNYTANPSSAHFQLNFDEVHFQVGYPSKWTTYETFVATNL